MIRSKLKAFTRSFSGLENFSSSGYVYVVWRRGFCDEKTFLGFGSVDFGSCWYTSPSCLIKRKKKSVKL